MGKLHRLGVNRRLFCTNVNNNLCSKLAFIGGGKMAEAFLSGIVHQKTQPLNKIMIADTTPARRNLFQSMGVDKTTDNKESG
eukprot:UN01424